jgi:hypothetical protein
MECVVLSKSHVRHAVVKALRKCKGTFGAALTWRGSRVGNVLKRVHQHGSKGACDAMVSAHSPVIYVLTYVTRVNNMFPQLEIFPLT